MYKGQAHVIQCCPTQNAPAWRQPRPQAEASTVCPLRTLPFLLEGERAELLSRGFRCQGWSGPWCGGAGLGTT